MHGIKISPDHQQAGHSQADRGAREHGTGQGAQQQQQQRQSQQQQQQSAAPADAPAPEAPVPMETAQATKRQLREAQRRAVHVPRRCRDVWQRFAGKAWWMVRRQLLDHTFTIYMRSRLSPKRDAQRKLCGLLTRARTRSLHRRAHLLHRLQGLFWRAWTARLFALATAWGQALGMCSLRDRYIYERAAALVPQHPARAHRGPQRRPTPAWTRHDPAASRRAGGRRHL